MLLVKNSTFSSSITSNVVQNSLTFISYLSYSIYRSFTNNHVTLLQTFTVYDDMKKEIKLSCGHITRKLMRVELC